MSTRTITLNISDQNLALVATFLQSAVFNASCEKNLADAKDAASVLLCDIVDKGARLKQNSDMLKAVSNGDRQKESSDRRKASNRRRTPPAPRQEGVTS